MKRPDARLNTSERHSNEPIAVVGMACRFPGAPDVEAFRRLLREGGDAIEEVPPDRWDANSFYDPNPNAPGRMVTKCGGFLEGIDRFDAAFFGISPREATSLDPQQRLLLEVTWEAIENAGIAPEELTRVQTGVFTGIGSQDYLRVLGDIREREPYYGTGNAPSVAAGRISYVLGLQGPSMAVDTACSSSLVAVHLACQSLRAGESDVALASGVNAILTPETSLFFSRMGAMSPDGRCKTFDAAANGYVRSEGCGVVVLKRRGDAIRANDRIFAVIRGSAVNHDGRSNGLTAPNGLAQQAVIRRALQQAAAETCEIGYLEAHGTGTALGDPIEVDALAQVFAGRAEEGPLMLGSVKTNLGHLEAAAGIAGLIKAVLSLHGREIFPNLHFHTPNPRCRLDGRTLAVATRLCPWEKSGARLAGVNAFGFSGTNAHIVLEEAPEPTAAPEEIMAPGDAAPWILPYSAKSAPALEQLGRHYGSKEIDASMCYTASIRRGHYEHRAAAMAGPGYEWNPVTGRRIAGRSPRVIFVFSGQGGQWPGMCAELTHERAFREAMERCQAVLPRLDFDSPGIDSVQPALFAFQMALAALWQSWGIRPAAAIGHSMGEVAAACIAGAISLKDAARIIVTRSRLMARLSGAGAMAVLDLSVADVEDAIAGWRGKVKVAVVNSPRSTVISGDSDGVAEILTRLESQGVFCRRVKVDVASHSPQMAELAGELMRELQGIEVTQPRIPFHSTTGADLCDGPEYWVRNLCEQVRFADTVERIAADCEVMLEIGPHPVLSSAMQECLENAPYVQAMGSLRRDKSSRAALLEDLARLYAAGCDPDWRELWHRPRPIANLPSYPWHKQRFWAEAVGPATPDRHNVGSYYDAGADYHLGGRDRESVFEGYLTWGMFPRVVDGFSWLRTVTFPELYPEHHKLLREAQARLRALLFDGLDFHRMSRVFDFGCGYGADAIELAKQYPGLLVEGYTISGRQAQIATERARREGLSGRVRILHRDSAKDDFPDRYDLIFGFEVAGLIREKDALFANVQRHLENGGCLILADFVANTESALESPETSTYSSTAAEWARYLGEHQLRLIDCRDVSEEIANCLDDPHFEEARREFDGQAELARHISSYPNICRALRQGTLQYRLFRARKDQYSPAKTLINANLERLGVAQTTVAAPSSGWLHGVEWVETATVMPGARRCWEVIGDDPELQRRLSAAGLAREPGGVVFLAREGAARLLSLLPRVTGRLYVVLRRGEPDDALVEGLARTITHEYPGLHCTTIESSGDPDQLVGELLSNSEETRVRLRDGNRMVARIRPVGTIGGDARIRSDRSYLITGGTGGLGLAVAEWLAKRGAGEVILAGRSTPRDEAVRVLNRCPSVRAVRADVTDEDQVRQMIDDAGSTRPLAGIVHAAGILDDGILQHLTEERMQRVIAPKARGAKLLYTYTSGLLLDFFAMFSGLASLFGSPGQGSYAAANAWLDAFAEHLSGLGYSAVSIQWGPWSETGLVAEQTESLGRRGVAAIPIEAGLDAFSKAISCARPQVAVFRLDPASWKQTYPALSATPFVTDLLRTESAEVGAHVASQSLASQICSEPAGWKRKQAIELYLRKQISEVLGLSLERVEPDSAPRDLGFDSLMALQLRNRIEKSLGIKLAVTVVWTYPTVATLASYLLDRIAPAAPAASEEQDLLGAIESMSDEQAQQLLGQLVEGGSWDRPSKIG